MLGKNVLLNVVPRFEMSNNASAIILNKSAIIFRGMLEEEERKKKPIFYFDLITQ